MPAHPLGSDSAMSSPEWNSSHIYNRSQLMACLRAAVIALVLLGILALIVLF